MRPFIVITIVGFATLSACNEVKVSDTDIPLINLRDLDTALSEEGTVLVDSRKPDAYTSGHLPNAVNIYLPDIREADERLGRAKRIVVYASGVRDPLGIAAAKRLAAMGYVNVQEFKGGVHEWKESGRELVGTLPPAQVRPETQK